MQASSRQVDGVTIVDLTGSITVDEGSVVLRKTVRSLSKQGSSKILLNLAGVTSVDSSGIGELVSAFISVRKAGGELKLLNLTSEVHDLLQITKLCAVFEVEDDEASALAAFHADTA
jgi:anti-sigma B factor antagonist